MAALEIRQLSERWRPHQTAQFGVEQGVDGDVGLGRNELGSLEQITIHRRGEVDCLGHAGKFISST